MRRISPPIQPRLFSEIAESQIIRDELTADGQFVRPPDGAGWRVADYGHEKHTTWQRRRPIVRPWKGKRTC